MYHVVGVVFGEVPEPPERRGTQESCRKAINWCTIVVVQVSLSTFDVVQREVGLQLSVTRITPRQTDSTDELGNSMKERKMQIWIRYQT